VVIVPDVILDAESTVDWEAEPIPKTCLADIGDRVRTLVPQFADMLVTVVERCAETEIVRAAAAEHGIDEHGVHAILLCPWHQLGWVLWLGGHTNYVDVSEFALLTGHTDEHMVVRIGGCLSDLSIC